MGYIHCMFYQNCISIVHWRQVCESLYEVCILLYIQTNLPFLTSTHDSLSYPITLPVSAVQGGGGNSWHLSSPTSCTGGRGLMTSLLHDQLCRRGVGSSWYLSSPTSCTGGEGGHLSSPTSCTGGLGGSWRLIDTIYIWNLQIYIYANKRIYI